MDGWFKAVRGDVGLELATANRNAFVLLYVMATRARRRGGFNRHNLQINESFLGDFSAYGMSQREYRTAKDFLSKHGFATFRATSKGTIGTIIDTRVFDINAIAADEQNDEQPTNDRQAADEQATSKRRAADEQPTTNKEGKKDKKERIEEGKKENGEGAALPPPPPPTEPDEMEILLSSKTENFRCIWADWMRSRNAQKGRAKLTREQFARQLRNFNSKGYTEAEIIEDAEKAICSGWQGLDPSRSRQNGRNGFQKPEARPANYEKGF